MGPSSTASMLLIAGVLTTLVAGMLWMRAFSGRVTAWHSCCRRCGFELRGLNPSAAACPECGADLSSAAALRPAARQNVPWRWWAAITMTSAGVLMIWFGQVSQFRMAGRWLCSILPTPVLMTGLQVMPPFAAAEVLQRVRSHDIDVARVPALVRGLAECAAANPGMRPQDAAEALAELRAQGLMDDASLTEALDISLRGVVPVGGKPEPCRPRGTFIATASLPASQATAWITQRELRIRIDTVTARLPDGSLRTLESVSTGTRPSREFDGAAVQAPDAPGAFPCEMSITLEQPGGGHRAQTAVPFRLTVVDPASLKLDFRPNASLAGQLRDWLAKGSAELDADGARLRVSLPGDVRPLQSDVMAIGGRVQVVQDAVVLDVGQVWIDRATPTVILMPAAMPAALDRSRPASLRLQPDAQVALVFASSSVNVLRDQVEVPIALPPPPPPAATEATEPKATTGASGEGRTP